MPENHTGYRISVVDEDPLRARKDARELLAALAVADSTARLDLPAPGSLTGSFDQGGPSAETVGLLLSAGSFVAALVQVWPARIPQRTIVVKRPDGAVLHVTGKEAREDDTLVERFLVGDGGNGTAAGRAAMTDNDRHALLVGVSTYDSRAYQDLPAVRADLHYMRAVLENTEIGMYNECAVAAEPTRAEMLHAVQPVEVTVRPKPIRLRMQQPRTIRPAPPACADLGVTSPDGRR
ncbi:hypothetical protein [Streptomyces prasinopilosus]|uniref:Uncharacterized protein n=1 Tax=Streptomyces prasinopilosus TaxID=67344 RepID=A0A1G6L9J6_9ACTN|nr:hypothetical protein [Streptomyces prasinopilosus]SDC39793.1 hypothetical protein SAMN05216505_10212 [Streptomyces prasinopilosus]